MSFQLSPEKNPYSAQNPFNVLGVSPSATAKEIQEAQIEKLEEINDAGYEEQIRIAKQGEIKRAYDAIRDAKSRASVEVFIFDSTVGRKESQAAAEKHKTLRFEFGQILKGADAAVLPSSPEMLDVRKQHGQMVMERSMQLKTAGDRLAIDPKAEALNSIAFDR